MASLNPELTELSLEGLRLRRSAKWRFYDEDVLPAWVAEMDFPLAPAVKIALAEAVELDDTGYGYPAALGLAEAFADFASGAARLGGRPGAGRRDPRRRQRDHLGAAADRQAGRPDRHQHARLPPLLRDHRGARLRAGRSAAGRRASSTSTRSTRSSVAAPSRSSSAAPTTRLGTLPTEAQLKALAASAAATRRLGAERRDPLAADPPRRPPRPLPQRLRGGARARHRPRLGLEGVQPRRPRPAPSPSPPPSAPPRSSRSSPSPPPTPGHFGLAGDRRRLPRRRPLARRRDRRPRPQPRPARRPAGGDAPRGRLHAAPGRLPHLARPARRSTSATTLDRGAARARPRRPQPGPGLRPAGRGPRAAQHRHLPGPGRGGCETDRKGGGT